MCGLVIARGTSERCTKVGVVNAWPRCVHKFMYFHDAFEHFARVCVCWAYCACHMYLCVFVFFRRLTQCRKLKTSKQFIYERFVASICIYFTYRSHPSLVWSRSDDDILFIRREKLFISANVRMKFKLRTSCDMGFTC